jgi:hypothetical protein
VRAKNTSSKLGAPIAKSVTLTFARANAASTLAAAAASPTLADNVAGSLLGNTLLPSKSVKSACATSCCVGSIS